MKYCSAILAVTLLCVAGCGGSSEPQGTLSGKVTYNGEPVSEGVVIFSSSGASFGAQADIEEDGSYTLSTYEGGVPPGTYEVAVLPPTITLPDTEDSPGGEALKEVDNIPQKYRSTQSSELTVTINEGSNTFDIAMEE
ncbi:carboxypeptidase-like regulatory domain-containing protein [Rubinisphaera sp. JC750]|uniref:carboxypeptidase-like regulatory domain-containing protein n=1 Tax=Rubinisphaera sp. JC750 TaxID=2898658 RepID=UPI001F22B1E4|nr:carboxypeptidase-like regulatory domain-containing protein [Rubinisphaera sp. JC750]